MKRISTAILATVLAVSGATPVSAHETTSWTEFTEAMSVAASFWVVPETSFEVPIAAALAGPAWRVKLLDIVPDPCYQELYAQNWLLYGDFLRLSEVDTTGTCQTR